MANLNYIIEFSFSFCTKCCTYAWENVNLNTEIHCHFTYCIAILHITLQIEFCYTYASIHRVSSKVFLQNLSAILISFLMTVLANNNPGSQNGLARLWPRSGRPEEITRPGCGCQTRHGHGMNDAPESAQIHWPESGCQNRRHWATITPTRIETLCRYWPGSGY